MPRYIKQFVVGITDFSSQYGGENPRSFSYSVSNLRGEPQIFPRYGDFTQAAVMRNYGPWWDRCFSHSYKKDKRPKSPEFVSQDYIDILFEQPVFPWSIAIYETYNPGSLVRILALCQEFPKQKSSSDEGSDVDSLDSVDPSIYGKAIPLPMVDQYTHWEVLWSNTSPQYQVTKEARMFAPILRDIKYRSRIIRLEFCHSFLDYYTELDAVELTGTFNYSYSSPVDPPTASMTSMSITSRISPSSSSEELGYTESKVDYRLTRDMLVTESEESPGDDKDEFEYGPNGYFSCLPPEIISRIFEYLPFPDFCQAACVCKLFHLHSYDTSQLSCIDLHSHWHLVNSNTLTSISSRCGHVKAPDGGIQSLNFKWLGGGDTVASDRLRYFFQSCNFKLLTYLNLASSPSVTDFGLIEIAKLMPNLTFLDIQSCDKITGEGIRELHALKNLESLNFYRTKADDAGVICITHSNPNLVSLNIGSCYAIRDYDRVLLELSMHCPKLRSLDTWRAKSLTSAGLNALTSKCKELEELDVGWCGNLLSSSGCFMNLVQSCPCLKKLFLTTNRSVSDTEINLIARNCPDLRQLDILGTRQVSAEAMENLLHRCKQMEFVDVSFCYSFTLEVVESLRQAYPKVSIKRSFQNS